jgi:hypothetical protein
MGLERLDFYLVTAAVPDWNALYGKGSRLSITVQSHCENTAALAKRSGNEYLNIHDNDNPVIKRRT